jgi:phage tail-like protein
MTFSVTSFKFNALQRGGYRPTLFEVEFSKMGQQFSYLCQATNVPALTVNPIEVPYFGRKIKVAGDRTYAEWTTTVMIDEDFRTRDIVEKWSMDINQGDTNRRTLFNEAYKEDVTIKMYGKAGNVLRRYKLIGAWPTEVGTIDLDWNTTDTIATYSVTWAFDYMNKP